MNAAKKHPPDFWFFVATLVLVVIGVLMVFDSSFARAADHVLRDPWFYVKRQIVYAAIGFLGLFAAMRTHPLRFRAITKIILLVSIALLGAVMLPKVGKSIGGAARWIPLGPFHLQPSELAKLALVMYLADRLAANGLRVRTFAALVPHLAIVVLVAGLVLAEPDMGTAVAVVLATGIMLFISGARKRHLAYLTSAGGLMAGILVAIEPYRLERVMTFLHPGRDYYGSGYQITHALIAVATGGLSGVGLCEGREKFFLPAPQTDMIGPTLGEEAGFIGMIVLLAFYVLFTYRGLTVGHRSKSQYTSLLAIGITSMISVQAVMNVAVFTASMPATGVPLPFISYGGSHLVVMLFGAGMVLSVSRHVDESIPEPEAERYENRHNRRRDRRAYLPGALHRAPAKGTRGRTPVHR